MSEIKRVVSITPLSLDADSRTFKGAASFARLGYESVVVEGRPSAPGWDLPFTVIAAEGSPPTVAAAGSDEPNARVTTPRALAGRLLRALRGVHAVDEAVRFLVLLSEYVKSCRSASAALPPASLYYLHSFQQYPGIWRAVRRHRTPFVYDAHDFYPVVMTENRASDRLMQAVFRLVERACIRAADRLVTVADGTADLIEGRYGRRPEVIRNFADVRLDLDPPSTLREAVGLPDEAFVLVMPANAKHSIPFASVAEALADLPDRVHLVFVGRGFDAPPAELAGPRLRDRAHFLPAVLPSQVNRFIAGADAAAITYYAATDNELNALPNAFFHAIAAGLPIIYPPLPEIRRIAEGWSLGIEGDPRAPAEFRDAVLALSEDPDRLARARRSVAAARGTLSWATEESRLAVIVEEQIGPPAT